MLEMRAVSKKFSGIKVVDGVSFVVRPGEVLGYLGPNGAGKTTTLRMLAGLLRPSSGEVFYDGRRVGTDTAAYKRRLGYVPEQSEIYPHLSALDYLFLVGRLRGLPERTLAGRAMEFLEILGLDDDRYAAIGAFSKGMRQKVLLAAALLHDPDILLLDEPLSGLDVTTGLVIRELILKLAAEGKIIIYSSHVLEVAEKVCSRVIILYQGRVVADDSVARLRELMHLPTLADIFSQLVIREDTGVTANRLVAAMSRDRG
jgi:ABC-2 type transport system ATP-binding protein